MLVARPKISKQFFVKSQSVSLLTFNKNFIKFYIVKYIKFIKVLKNVNRVFDQSYFS